MYEVGEIPMESREVVRDKQNPKMSLERSLTLGDALLLLLGFQKLQPTLLAGLNPSLFANETGKKKRYLLELDGISPLVGGGGEIDIRIQRNGLDEMDMKIRGRAALAFCSFREFAETRIGRESIK